MKGLGIIFVFVVYVAGCATTTTQDSFAKVFGQGTHVITLSKGGNVKDFILAANEVLKTGKHIKIDGYCLSACATFADIARSNVCITRSAVFGFHMATYTTMFVKNGIFPVTLPLFSAKILPTLRSDIMEWIEKNGGFKSKGFLLMDFKEALVFWPQCK